MLDRPLLQMIKNLVAGDLASASCGLCIFEIVHIEIADAAGQYLAARLQRGESRKRLGERI